MGKVAEGKLLKQVAGVLGPQIQGAAGSSPGTAGASMELEVLRLLLWACGVPTDPRPEQQASPAQVGAGHRALQLSQDLDT